MNVLRDDQSYISDTFAGSFKDTVDDKFACADWHAMTTGAPRVADPLVAFDCKVASSGKVGTHHIFMGEVQETHISGRGSPLIYANRAYGATSRINGVRSIATGQAKASMTLSVTCFHSFGPYLMPELIRKLTDGDPQLQVTPVEGDQRRIQSTLLFGEYEIGLLYDHDLPEDLNYDTLAALELYVLLAESDLLTTKPRISPQDLMNRPMILLDGPPTE